MCIPRAPESSWTSLLPCVPTCSCAVPTRGHPLTCLLALGRTQCPFCSLSPPARATAVTPSSFPPLLGHWPPPFTSTGSFSSPSSALNPGPILDPPCPAPNVLSQPCHFRNGGCHTPVVLTDLSRRRWLSPPSTDPHAKPITTHRGPSVPSAQQRTPSVPKGPTRPPSLPCGAHTAPAMPRFNPTRPPPGPLHAHRT